MLDAIMGGPFSLAKGLGKAVFNAGRTFIKKGNDGNSNFWSAHTKAEESGKELAHQLVEHFSDRHITLVGFSMGTEVIRACVEELISLKREDILFKVATLGGVAEQSSI